MASDGRRPDPWAPVDAGGRVSPEELARPRSWSDRRRVLVSPDVDLFDGGIERASIEAVMAEVAATGGHDYFLCTDRAKRLLMLGNEGLRFPPNLWVGVPVSTDEDIWRVEDLLRCNTDRPWVRIDRADTPLAGLPLPMLRLLVLRAPDRGGLAARCRQAGVTVEEW